MVRFILLLITVVCLAFGGSFVYRGWIRPVSIKISLPRSAGAPGRAGSAPAVAAFNLDAKYRLTSVKVVAVDRGSTNPASMPLWHLVSATGSKPVDRILYGLPIDGMSPVQSNNPPQRLIRDITYRLILEAGKARGQLDFSHD